MFCVGIGLLISTALETLWVTMTYWAFKNHLSGLNFVGFQLAGA